MTMYHPYMRYRIFSERATAVWVNPVRVLLRLYKNKKIVEKRIVLDLFRCVPFHHKLDNEEYHECNDDKINDRSNKIPDKEFY